LIADVSLYLSPFGRRFKKAYYLGFKERF
jgi:hypothetical protein